jgi:ribonuclease HI
MIRESQRRKKSDAGARRDLFGDLEQKRPPNYCMAYVDGGARGNPGPAGYGVVVEDHTRRRLATLSKYLGHQTNNYAEYSALIAALQYAVQHDCKALKVVSDSELMVRQVRGEYKVKNAVLQELHAQIRALLLKLDWFEIEHVLREKNREADRLANAAMDTGRGKAGSQAASINAQSADPKPIDATRELNGIVRGGVIELLGDELPDGTMVQIRVKPR